MGNETTAIAQAWASMRDSIDFAVDCVVNDVDECNEREAADGHQYVLRILRVVSESSLLSFDPLRPAFLPMLDAVRFLGAAGPDIDYDVAIVQPGVAHRVTGLRGGATFVGIAVYGFNGEKGASGIVASVDVDDLVAADGSFTYEFHSPEAARVIVRQYFHDRATQARGSWTIERLVDNPSAPTSGATLPTVATLATRLTNASDTLRWNAQLNRLWSPELRSHPNALVRQTPDDIVAAVTNPDVMYAFSWWKLADDEALVIDVVPPETKYWSVQLCDRWFQCFPDRQAGLNDRQMTRRDDGTVRIVVAPKDPGGTNWLDTSGHRTGILFFRWLHADPAVLPTCRVVPMDELSNI